MIKHCEILIIGGGVSGMLTARELRLAGCDVTILDKSPAGRESSWAGGGILLPIYPWRQSPAISDLVMGSLHKYPDLNRELLDATGIDPQWRDCGLLICRNPDFAAAVSWCLQRGVTYQEAPTELLAGLQSAFQNPLWLPEIAQIRNPRLLKSLQAYLLKLGVVFLENTQLLEIVSQNQRVQRVVTSAGNFIVQQLVICTGAWTSDVLQALVPECALNLAIQPVKGQMLVFDAKPDTLPNMVLNDDQYLIPRQDGKILAGSTVEAAGFEKSTTSKAKQQLWEFATALLPALKQYPISHHWAGLRPGAPQGIPYIGRHPTIENLSINAGHFRNGLVMGPASAQLLADLLLDRPTSINPEPYALAIEKP